MVLRLLRLAFIVALASPAAAEAPPAGGCAYEVTLGDAEARTLSVAVMCDGDGPHRLGTYRTITNAHIRDVTAAEGSSVAKDADSWVLRGKGGAARAAYRFDVDEMAETTNATLIGQRIGGSVVASLRSFLLVPEGGAKPMTLSIRFVVPAGAGVATGLLRRGDVYSLHTRDIPELGYMAMGRIRQFAVPVPGRNGAGAGSLDVAILDAPLKAEAAALKRWIADSAALIAAYFGGFPTTRGLIVLQPVEGARYLRRGTVVGGGGATMLLLIGSETEARDLYGQWMLTHELVHFGAPFVPGHPWLMEGMAVYAETRLRVGAGWFPNAAAWRGFLRNFRQGETALQYEGLAHARGIGPVYWGGTLFMLLADAAILEQSQGKRSLADCFKAVLDRGGDTTEQWTLDRFVAACDPPTGGVFRRLVEAHVAKGSRVDLAGLWKRLGVTLAVDDSAVSFDDAAPLAWVRKRIMAGPATR